MTDGKALYAEITVREYLAGVAMMGLLANPGVYQQLETAEQMSDDCVAYADALIASLNKEEE